MFDLSPVVLGITLFFLGLAFVLLILLFLRLIPRIQPLAKNPAVPPKIIEPSPHNEAVLLIRSGGRVVYLNQQAREFFNIWEEEPNLESLARRTRPSEAFLTLCASEGKAQFSINGRFVEGTSYFAPGSIRESTPRQFVEDYRKQGDDQAQYDAILVSLRRPQFVIGSDAPLMRPAQAAEPTSLDFHPADISTQTLSIFTELSQAMTASLDLEVALQTILESVERLLPSDILEITVWEADEQHLVPYRLVGLPGLDRRLDKGPERYRADQGYSGYLITDRKPLLVKDVNTFRLVRPVLNRQRYPFQSYMGVPLLIAGELIGTLELASLTKENYNESDLEVLGLLSGQAAVALNNALLYEKELQRSVELAGLANLAQAVSAIRDPQDLYNRLIESISPLIPVEILGFLVYDENRHVLEGQAPFMGIPPNVIELYQTTIQPDSPAEAIWQSGEAIITTNASEDPRLQELGLVHVMLAASIRHTAFMPLTSSGRVIGYLQVANKRDGSSFDSNDLRLLAIITGQAAPIIENATLVQQSRHRAQRAETLRRIASLTNSAATLDEILKFSTLDLARLLQADVVAILLLDEMRGELCLHKNSVFGIPPEISILLEHIPVDDPGYALICTSSKQSFHSGDLSLEASFPSVYRPLLDDLIIRSVVNVPLLMRERVFGELILGSFRQNFFSHGDEQTVTTVAGQLSAAIERSALYTQTDQNLRQRVEQLTTLTRINRELNPTLELEHLLQRVYNEMLKATRADCGTLLIFEPKKDQQERWLEKATQTTQSEDSAQPHSSNPELSTTPCVPAILFEYGDQHGHELHPLEEIALEKGELVVVNDFTTEETVRAAHSNIRSAMVLPIHYQDQVTGIIHLHSRMPNHFGEVECEVAEALALHSAISLQNAQRYQEQVKRSQTLNQRLDSISKLTEQLFEVSHALQTEQSLEQSLETIAKALQTVTPFEKVLISLYDAQKNQLFCVAGAGFSLAAMAEIRARPQSWDSIQSLLNARFSLGRSYFIPSEQKSIIPEDVDISTDQSFDAQPGEEHDGHITDGWQSGDVLIVPLFGTIGDPLGLISVDAPRTGLRPDRLTIETLEIFGSQAGVIIESQQKTHELRSQAEKIQSRLELAQKAAQQAQSHLPVLLHKDLEQTLAIQQLSQQARRINAGLDIAEIVSKKNNRVEVFYTLGQETLGRMDFDVVLIAEPKAGGLDLIHKLGNIPSDVNPMALLGQRNPLRHCLQSGEILLVSNLTENEEWRNTPLLKALDARSFICFPIAGNHRDGMTNDQIQAEEIETTTRKSKQPLQSAILAVSRTPLAPFTSDDEQLFDLLTRQVSNALQNLSLLDETARRLREVNLLLGFSRQLGSLDPSSILRTLMESALSAVPTAQTAMIVLWDARRGLLVPEISAGYVDQEALMEVLYQPGEGIPGQVFEQKRTLLLDEVDFARHYNLSSENLLHYRDATGGCLPVSTMVVPIMAGLGQFSERTSETGAEFSPHKDQERAIPLGVLVLDNAQSTAAFTENNMAVVTSLAQQTALTLENARLYQASQQRSKQLQALTDVSTTITSSLQPDELVATLLDQLQAILPYDTGTLWLRQKEGIALTKRTNTGKMVIRAARGFEDSDQRVGLTIDVQDSQLLDEMIQTGRPIWVANVLKDPRFGPVPLESEIVTEAGEEIPTTALGYKNLSWLGVPLIASGEVIGVIALEKAEPNFYRPDDIQVATTFAGQAAVGLENAELYQESVNRAMELDLQSQTLTILNRLSSELSGSLDATRILGYAVREFQQILGCTSATVLVSDYGTGEESEQEYDIAVERGSGKTSLQAEYLPWKVSEDTPYNPGSILPHTPLFDRLFETQGIFNTEDVDQEPELEPLQEFLARHRTRSLLVVPIVSGGTLDEEVMSEPSFHGMLLAHNSIPYRFSADEVELARTISNQVAIALQNARLYEETRNLTEHLELRVQQRTAELAYEHKRAETLLRIITELSVSLDLDQVLNSTLQVLREYVDAEQITIMIVRSDEQKLHRLASVGYTPQPPSDGSSTPFSIDQGLAGWIITQRQSVLIDDVLQDERWIKVALQADSEGEKEQLFAIQHRSAMGVPLMSGAEALGCLLLYHPNPEHFSDDQLELVQAAANQVAIAVNNAELYRLIRDQAEDLGNLLRTQQIETSRSKAILEAVADGVLVTDANRQITLFNQSAEKILGLERSKVLGKSMEHFTGLFGRATRSWMETIRTWSQDPATYQPGDIYVEQIVLEDARVISVHLSPVSLRNDFLGTVSIFQDITHQVEVDRLKSEFVATVSHELRTPMTSIKGYVEILLLGAAGALNDQQSHFLRIVKTNTERLTVLVNDLLDISQIESGRVAISLQPLYLEDIVDQAITELVRQTESDKKAITISKEIQPSLPLILGDSGLIRRALDNLLDNAYQYNTPEGRITVVIHRSEDEVQVDVKDTGVGICPEDKERVFERFFRGDNPLVLGVAGTGLGLSIVKNLIEMQNGRIWLESSGIPGEGSTFSFTLPIYKPKEQRRQRKTSHG